MLQYFILLGGMCSPDNQETLKNWGNNSAKKCALDAAAAAGLVKPFRAFYFYKNLQGAISLFLRVLSKNTLEILS